MKVSARSGSNTHPYHGMRGGNAAVLDHASPNASSSFWPGAFTVPSPLTYMYRVVVVMPRRCARSCALVSRSAMARIAMRSMATSILRGRPPRRPLARAAARPARVRSTISSRSNSASAAKMPKIRRPLAGAGVDLGAGASQHAQADTAGAQFVHGRHQMFQVASEAVQLPDDEGVARLQRLEAGIQARAVIPASRGAVFVEALLVNAGVEQGVTLQVEELAAVRL